MLDRRLTTRVLFNTWANHDNINSQSLTAREIAHRLDPERFTSSFFLGRYQQPDPRFADRPNIQLLCVPPRLGSFTIARELLWGTHDIVFYPTLNSRAYQLAETFSWLGKNRKIVDCVETSLAQIESCSEDVQLTILRSLRRADVRSAITPTIARDLVERHGLESMVIPLGVDLDVFQPADRSGRRSPWRVLYVASIQARKQTHLILELARRLQQESVEFHCIGPVLGDPEYHRRLLREKERDGLENVLFHGALSQREIYLHMEQADVYVLPSRLEGFGKTTLEAAASGLPAIVFSDYETTAVVDSVTGFQVDTLDDMERALRRLLDDPELRRRMGHAASEHAQLFTWTPVARRWEEVFDELMRKGDGT